MKHDHFSPGVVRPSFLLGCLAAALLAPIPRAAAAPNIVLWDTGSALVDSNRIGDRGAWKVVPTDLLALESDPPKASSDPGYYGRAYDFKGDAVVENRYLTAVFSGAKGAVVVFSKPNLEGPADNQTTGARLLELIPRPADNSITPSLKRIEILRHAGDDVALKAVFATSEGTESVGLFVFGRSEIIEVKPLANLKQIRVKARLACGILPTFIGDDLVFSAGNYTNEPNLYLPAENAFIGLAEGKGAELVLTWPQANQGVKLGTGNSDAGTRAFEYVDFENDGGSFYLAALQAPGIWHNQTLEPDFLEKDVSLEWRPPFPARWKTQLEEETTLTTFAFRSAKGQVWRGVPGSYQYPAWFDDTQAFLHLSKKVPPKGEAIIYALEAKDTPAWVSMPEDVLQATLGRAACEAIFDLPGRQLRTHHRRGGDGVRRACTCGCTEAIQAVFEAGQETERKDYIRAAIEDMIYFVHQHVNRINEYRKFANDLQHFLETKGKASPELKDYAEGLAQTANRIPQEYEVQKEHMQSFTYADELAQKTLALADKADPNNLKQYMELLKAWRDMGGAQDYVLAQCHTITRKISQQAGYDCVSQPKAVPLAREIRARCRDILRHPDGYEIWADY